MTTLWSITPPWTFRCFWTFRCLPHKFVLISAIAPQTLLFVAISYVVENSINILWKYIFNRNIQHNLLSIVQCLNIKRHKAVGWLSILTKSQHIFILFSFSKLKLVILVTVLAQHKLFNIIDVCSNCEHQSSALMFSTHQVSLASTLSSLVGNILRKRFVPWQIFWQSIFTVCLRCTKNAIVLMTQWCVNTDVTKTSKLTKNT